MTYTAPKATKYQGGRLDNGAYGFPQGSTTRRIKPWVLHCAHITGNTRTARMPVGTGNGTGTRAEVAYMARPRHFGGPHPDLGNTAHDYVARDGSRLTCIPTSIAAWNNGRLARPNTRLKSVQRIVAKVKAGGFNANEAYVREVEYTGSPGRWKLTPEQRETMAYLIARDSLQWNVSITRETVHLHADLDGVDRLNCPFSASSREAQLGSVLRRARVIRRLLRTPDQPAPPDAGPDPEPAPDACAEAQQRLEVALGDIEDLTRHNVAMSQAIVVAVGALDDFMPEEDDDDS